MNPEDPDGLLPDGLLGEMAADVMRAIGESFFELWRRPEAHEYLAAFLDGRAEFIVRRDEILVNYPPGLGPQAN